VAAIKKQSSGEKTPEKLPIGPAGSRELDGRAKGGEDLRG